MLEEEVELGRLSAFLSLLDRRWTGWGAESVGSSKEISLQKEGSRTHCQRAQKVTE